jgi:hypothetical protein
VAAGVVKVKVTVSMSGMRLPFASSTAAMVMSDALALLDAKPSVWVPVPLHSASSPGIVVLAEKKVEEKDPEPMRNVFEQEQIASRGS